MKNDRYNSILALAKDFDFKPYHLRSELSFPCKAIIIYLRDELSIKDILDRFKTQTYETVICQNMSELEKCFDVFKHMTYEDDCSVFLLANCIQNQKIEHPFFIKNLLTPILTSTDNCPEMDEQFVSFLEKIKKHDLIKAQSTDNLSVFIGNYRTDVLHAFNSEFYVDEGLQLQKWMLGDGFAVPYELATIQHAYHKTSKKKITLFEAAIYSNIVVLNRYLLPSFSDDLVENSLIETLIKYLNFILDYNFPSTKTPFILGNQKDFEIVAEGYFFILDINDKDHDYLVDLLQEVDQSFYIAQIDPEEKNIIVESITKVYEGYNNGHFKDIIDMFTVTQQHNTNHNLTLLCKIG